MKRYALALLIHPYKTGVVPRSQLRASTSLLIETLCSVLLQYPQMRFNLVLPGYILEAADPLLSARLRDLCKRLLLEMICTGYTEPFLSLSPADLSVSNIMHGVHVIEELTGQTPRGFLPPFSNWEPSFIKHLRTSGFRYSLLSNELFSHETQNVPGYWVAEHTGSSIGLIGTNILDTATIKNNFIDTIKTLFTSEAAAMQDPFAVLHYLMPLQPDKLEESCANILHMAKTIDKNLLHYQPVCISDFISTVNPVGMQYIPASLQTKRCGTVDLHFMNYLFSFDQIGFLQRKVLDIFERLTPYLEGKKATTLLHELFFAQDINRFLPGNEAGFEVASDRSDTYRHIINIDANLRQLSQNSGVRTRITDFLHNGGKTIIISNKNLKLFIDPQNGGQITGLDFRPRQINLCSMYNPQRRKLPDIIVSGSSRTWFLDRILQDPENSPDSATHLFNDTSNLQHGAMSYKMRKNSEGSTLSLMQTGSFINDEKIQPLLVEKVFGIENEHAEISFVYQFSNPSLIQYHFIFATELNLFFPGFSQGEVQLSTGKCRYSLADNKLLQLPDLTSWYIEDPYGGIRVTFQMQKPATIWCLPSPQNVTPDGIPLIMTTAVIMEPSSRFKIVGKISCKPLKAQAGLDDAL